MKKKDFLDGTAECHDRSRKMKNGQPSYALILRNLDRAITLLPDCHFSIRVNVVKIHPDGDFFIVTLIICPDSDCFPLMQGMCRGAKENHVKQDGSRCT